MLQFNVQFDRSRLDCSRDYEGHLMVSLEAEDVAFERTPVCVVLVLAPSNRMVHLRSTVPAILEAIESGRSGELLRVGS